MAQTLLGIELLVDRLDRAIELFTDVLGMTVIERGPARDIAGEVALIDAGSVVITLMEAHSHGPGPVLPQREPRLSQLVVAPSVDDELDAVRGRCVAAGAAIAPLGDGAFYVTPECVEGAIGFRTAVVVTKPVNDAG